MSLIRAIVFDMDGLMVDSEPLAQQAWEVVLAGYGCHLDDRIYHQLIGLRLADSSRLLQQHFALAVDAADLAIQKSTALAELRSGGIPPMPGLEVLLQALAERQIPWAVATSSGRAYAQAVLGQLGATADCRALATGDEVKHGKPAPDIYLLAAERLGVAPEACLALEDSVPGGQAAVAAGMILAAVPGPHVAAADFAFADYVFSSLSQVARQLDRLLNGQ